MSALLLVPEAIGRFLVELAPFAAIVAFAFLVAAGLGFGVAAWGLALGGELDLGPAPEPTPDDQPTTSWTVDDAIAELERQDPVNETLLERLWSLPPATPRGW